MRDGVKKSAFRPKYRQLVDAKCRECIYDSSLEGSWRFQVEKCTSRHCPLYPVRAKTIKCLIGEKLDKELNKSAVSNLGNEEQCNG